MLSDPQKPFPDYGAWKADGAENHSHICSVCRYKQSEAHFAESTWQQADDGHYHPCLYCGWAMDRTAHTYGAWKANGAENHSHTCSVCRYKQSEAHTWDDDQRCTVCGFSAEEVAIVSIEGAEDKAFTELTDAWAYAASNSSADKPATVRLVLSTNIYRTLDVSTSKNIILEMADGVTLLFNASIGVRVNGGNFTLNSGTIQIKGDYPRGILVRSGGAAWINSGSVKAEGASTVCIRVEDASSSLHINGGDFSGTTTVYVAGGTATISGGTFSSTGTGDSQTVFRSVAYKVSVVDLIAEGHLVYDEDGNRVDSALLKNALLKGGPYTVRECDHSYGCIHEKGTTIYAAEERGIDGGKKQKGANGTS